MGPACIVDTFKGADGELPSPFAGITITLYPVNAAKFVKVAVF